MAKISWERPGIRVVEGVGKSGTDLWISWHFKEIPLGTGLNGPPVIGGEYTAYMAGKRVGDVFHSLKAAEAELEKADTLALATAAE